MPTYLHRITTTDAEGVERYRAEVPTGAEAEAERLQAYAEAIAVALEVAGRPADDVQGAAERLRSGGIARVPLATFDGFVVAEARLVPVAEPLDVAGGLEALAHLPEVQGADAQACTCDVVATFCADPADDDTHAADCPAGDVQAGDVQAGDVQAGDVQGARAYLLDASGHRLGLYRSRAEALEALGRRPDARGGSVQALEPEPAAPSGRCNLPGDEFGRAGGYHVCDAGGESFRRGYCADCEDVVEAEGFCGHGSYPDTCGAAGDVCRVTWRHAGDTAWIDEDVAFACDARADGAEAEAYARIESILSDAEAGEDDLPDADQVRAWARGDGPEVVRFDVTHVTGPVVQVALIRG